MSGAACVHTSPCLCSSGRRRGERVPISTQRRARPRRVLWPRRAEQRSEWHRRARRGQEPAPRHAASVNMPDVALLTGPRHSTPLRSCTVHWRSRRSDHPVRRDATRSASRGRVGPSRAALRQGHEQVAAERHAWPACLPLCAPPTTRPGITRDWRAADGSGSAVAKSRAPPITTQGRASARVASSAPSAPGSGSGSRSGAEAGSEPQLRAQLKTDG